MDQSTRRLAIIFLLLLLAIALLKWSLNRESDHHDTLIQFSPDVVQKISIYQGTVHYSFEHLNSQWRYSENPNLEIDRQTFQAYLSDVSRIVSRREIVIDEHSKDEWGLRQSDRSVVIQTDKDRIEIQVGNLAPEAGMRFVRIQGDHTVQMISDRDIAILFKPPSEFSSTRHFLLLNDFNHVIIESIGRTETYTSSNGIWLNDVTGANSTAKLLKTLAKLNHAESPSANFEIRGRTLILSKSFAGY